MHALKLTSIIQSKIRIDVLSSLLIVSTALLEFGWIELSIVLTFISFKASNLKDIRSLYTVVSGALFFELISGMNTIHHIDTSFVASIFVAMGFSLVLFTRESVSFKIAVSFSLLNAIPLNIPSVIIMGLCTLLYLFKYRELATISIIVLFLLEVTGLKGTESIILIISTFIFVGLVSYDSKQINKRLSLFSKALFSAFVILFFIKQNHYISGLVCSFTIPLISKVRINIYQSLLLLSIVAFGIVRLFYAY